MVVVVLLLGSIVSSHASDERPVDDDRDEATVSPESTSESESDDTSTVVVYGELLVDQARSKVAKELQRQGYTERIREEDYTIYRHSEAWKGEVRVYDDGWVRIKRQPVQFKPPEKSPLGWATCVLPPLCIKAGGQTVSKRIHMSQRRFALSSLGPLAQQYGDRVADLRVDRQLESLGDDLDTLWTTGKPFGSDEAPLVSPLERRTYILKYWESRTDTIWGRRVRAATEAFIREVIQYSDHALSEADIATFNANRTCEQALDLNRPWSEIVADLEHRAGE